MCSVDNKQDNEKGTANFYALILIYTGLPAITNIIPISNDIEESRLSIDTLAGIFVYILISS